MSRSLSVLAVQSLLHARTGEVFIFLIRLSHVLWASDIYLAGNPTNITSNGNVYIAFPMTVVLPKATLDGFNSPPTLVVDGTDRQIIAKVRSVPDGIQCFVSLILLSAPDTVLLGEDNWNVVGYAAPSGTRVTLGLADNNLMAQKIPQHTFNPTEFRAIP